MNKTYFNVIGGLYGRLQVIQEELEEIISEEQFDYKINLPKNLQEGEIMRVLLSRTTMESTRRYWSFGIVGPDCFTQFIDIQIPTQHGSFFLKLRKDGTEKLRGKTRQIAFPLTEKEKQTPLIKELLSILTSETYQREQLRFITLVHDLGKINMFPAISSQKS